jgi:hypothetical protein
MPSVAVNYKAGEEVGFGEENAAGLAPGIKMVSKPFSKLHPLAYKSRARLLTFARQEPHGDEGVRVCVAYAHKFAGVV